MFKDNLPKTLVLGLKFYLKVLTNGDTSAKKERKITKQMHYYY
jgi:hypothetical protein